MKTAIIYHQIKPGTDCPDGIWSAYVASLKFPDADIIGACYQSEAPDVSEYSKLVIVDFSFPAPVLESWADRGKEVLVIDHHKTAMNDLAQLSDRILQRFDMAECGATLAWKYFFPEQPVPAILGYVRDRDLWNFDLEKSEELHEAVAHIGRSFALFDALIPLDQDRLVKAFSKLGERLLKPKRERVAQIAETAKWATIAGYGILTVEVDPKESRLISDICSHMYRNNPHTPFVMAYNQLEDGQWSLSFRADKNKGFDVSAVAKLFGGGGHENSAGCRVISLDEVFGNE